MTDDVFSQPTVHVELADGTVMGMHNGGHLGPAALTLWRVSAPAPLRREQT
ncbi:hypothetical protein [Streptomyces aurantiogriseus]|uniref:Uncharacterized protein n=1 Tax=Streptomyces aurantiogriseus TaxID=66870 RepID=A0A918KV60_9ACTN|nr:hypothetical protein [Streptomyces aurantiogriseus]GGR35225.1 hypothetical protein GCM10010251_59360 [Streptomyces aurantiogriseus]